MRYSSESIGGRGRAAAGLTERPARQAAALVTEVDRKGQGHVDVEHDLAAAESPDVERAGARYFDVHPVGANERVIVQIFEYGRGRVEGIDNNIRGRVQQSEA